MILVPWGNSIRNSMILDSSVPSSSSAEPIYVCIVHSGRAAPTLHIHYLQTVLVLHQLFLHLYTPEQLLIDQKKQFLANRCYLV